MRSSGDFAADDRAPTERPEAPPGNRSGNTNRSQREIAEEALTLKQTGATALSPPTSPQMKALPPGGAFCFSSLPVASSDCMSPFG